MRTFGVVTVSRSDYGIYLPILRKICSEPDLQLHLIASGMHLSPEFGLTVSSIETDGFEVAERMEMLLSSDTPEGISKSVGLGLIGFSQLFSRFRPDILIVLGDRFEMHAAALAALPFKIPVAHIHGGEITQGAIDDALRHSITKLSHLHFVSTEEYSRRVRQLGEEPWRVCVSGAPSLDNLNIVEILSPSQIETRFGVCLKHPPLLVTFHPVTLEYEQAEWQANELLAALSECGLPIIFTMPNADTGNSIIRQKISEYQHGRTDVWSLESMGTQGYFGLMRIAAAMIGNSSSGIIEAPSFGLPVVNIGTRQAGRVRAANVLDVGCERREILNGIAKALSPTFRESLCNLRNPYGDGQAADRIVQKLKTIPLGPSLVQKKFCDLQV
ncbi:MAG: UDP-N-acetylglucosamine 2-epimerase (hydrolyzing) [Candidatus Omnitrophica bacterium]|nr:UDP-N-acetylglucosamine 2-epimerase (hydrolyzing) [Candidatus Omnitrophota bacterium]